MLLPARTAVFACIPKHNGDDDDEFFDSDLDPD